MSAVCQRSVKEGWTHFFYGGKDGVAEELKERMESRYPGIRVVGTFCPPFRKLTADEVCGLEEQVKAANPDLFWVGISTPKQEHFMSGHLSLLSTRVMLGVGAAFDLHTGRMIDSPAWIKKMGMQWFHRLCQEPTRLWRRYAYIVPAFLFLITLQLLGIIRYEVTETPGRIKKIFYSSSACIYPAYNQEDPENPKYSEESAYPAAPGSEYGWEKLFSEGNVPLIAAKDSH